MKMYFLKLKIADIPTSYVTLAKGIFSDQFLSSSAHPRCRCRPPLQSNVRRSMCLGFGSTPETSKIPVEADSPFIVEFIR